MPFVNSRQLPVIITDVYVIYAGVSFPRNFLTISKTILKRLFRVYAHIYHAHFDDIIELREEVCTTNAVANVHVVLNANGQGESSHEALY